MFNKLKQFKDLRNQAKTLQNALSGESVTVDKKGVKLTMNGNMEVTELKITEELSNEDLEKVMTDLINDAIKKTQKLMAQKIQSMGGLQNFNM